MFVRREIEIKLFRFKFVIFAFLLSQIHHSSLLTSCSCHEKVVYLSHDIFHSRLKRHLFSRFLSSAVLCFLVVGHCLQSYDLLLKLETSNKASDSAFIAATATALNKLPQKVYYN